MKLLCSALLSHLSPSDLKDIRAQKKPHICPCLTPRHPLREMTALIRRHEKLRLHLEDFAPGTNHFYLPFFWANSYS